MLQIKQSPINNPLLRNIIQKATDHSRSYIKYYEKLASTHHTTDNAEEELKKLYAIKWSNKISKAVKCPIHTEDLSS